MTPYEIISKKRDGGELTPEELDFFIGGFTGGHIPDYQMAALLMAIYFRGMTTAETITLTRLMRDSGEVVVWCNIPGVKVDKHSTGGVGDKVSLVLAPLVAAAGIHVPMMSGRSLGHTGGTLDKLESIPGFRTQLSIEEFRRQVAEIGVAMIGQTETLAPADRKLYALRDATATIPVKPLVVSSILSKKLAEGIDALVLDVKVGRGAFFADEGEARALAEALQATAESFGLKTVALLTSMDEPLGRAVGNWLEVREAIDALQARKDTPEDLMEVTLALGSWMLILGQKARTVAEGREILEKTLRSGAAYQKLLTLVERQGGDKRFVEEPDRYPLPSPVEVRAECDGFIARVDALEVGLASMLLGAGRKDMQDDIDPAAGIVLLKKSGDAVKRGETLAKIYTRNQSALNEAMPRIEKAFAMANAPVERPRLILGLIDSERGKPYP